jgi:hypothetical protein
MTIRRANTPVGQKRDGSGAHNFATGDVEAFRMTVGDEHKPGIGGDGRGVSGWTDEPERRQSHSMSRLQPVVLGPPPEPGDVGASYDDDLDPAELQRSSPVGRLMATVAITAVVLATGAGAWWLTVRATPSLVATTPAAPQPAAAAPPPVSPPLRESTAPTVEEPPSTPAQAPQPRTVDMADVGSDLIAPSTEGLSPARKVQAIRIIVENDRELQPLR